MRKRSTRVNHEKMIKCLNDIGINGKDLKLIVNLYWTQRTSIRLEKNLSDEIRIKRGVRQDVCCHHASLTYTQRPSLDT